MAQNYVFNNLINVKFELRFRDLSDANLCYIVMQTCFIQCITKSRGGGMDSPNFWTRANSDFKSNEN